MLVNNIIINQTVDNKRFEELDNKFGNRLCGGIQTINDAKEESEWAEEALRRVAELHTTNSEG